ncbi:hypothetical protein CMQ_4403 [Grosmannia clavigera kw1407]|uniref:Uncharacterized protein n=1 Tax=Grosmannia clavigera (strain kw1407 / UAMH 11150) TaxID=655863 RepID=F0XUL1_GROCL|nr:uncharacterized protein CMQ_4403 [Grosmannia clavigera kw1407]EFW98551.1 hypothetical protein CMQ_4403 [Grosmannia clavigera kw1407]
MLLTSSQVSVAVSSTIVILCTSALFFSGYVLQQRTLNELRQSLKEPPPTPPKIFLPDRFKKMTTELEDGTIVILDDDDDDTTGVGGDAPTEVVVQASISVAEDNRRQEQVQLSGETTRKEETSQEDSQGNIDHEQEVTKLETSEHPKKPVSKAERRRLIKEEIRRLSHYEKPMLYQRRLY